MRGADATADRETASRAGPDAEERPSVIAYISDDISEQAVRGALMPLEPRIVLRKGTIRDATRALEREPTPHVLIVDLAGVADPVEALEALAVVCMPDVRVLVVGERADIGLYRDLTQRLGVVEYIYKPLTRDNVASLFGPHLTDSVQEGLGSRGGRVTCVCGVRGGAGATTIAVNLALQIADSVKAHVAVVDLHLRGGTAAMMFGARASAGLRVALEQPDRVDTLFIDRVGVPIEERVRLIAADEPMDSDPRPTADGLSRVISLLRQRFNHVILDVPFPPGPQEREVMALSRSVVLVMPPDVAGIRDAVAMRKLASNLTGASRTLVVLNRAGKPGYLKDRLVTEGLGSPPEVVVPDLPRHLPRAANFGTPALRSSAAFARALAPLTREIAGTRVSRPAGWMRFFSRGAR